MGCGSSFSASAPTKSKKSPSTKVTGNDQTDKSNKLPPIKPEQKPAREKDRGESLEPFVLVCLDNRFDDDDNQLRSIIDYVRCFSDSEQCEEFISGTSKNTFVFFIVSNQHFNDIISRVHQLLHVIAIYVLQDNTKHNSQKDGVDKHWTKRYSKLKGIYFEREGLLEQLTFDVKIAADAYDLIPITVYSRIDAVQTNSNSNDHLRFLFHQLFIQRYCVNSPVAVKRTDLQNILSDYYSTNRKQLKVLRKFDENYTVDNEILAWLTKDCFIRRILTQSLLTLNINILFAVRFFIKDVFKVMAEHVSLSNKRLNPYPGSLTRFANGRSANEQMFYRGQALSKQTLTRIKSNIGELMSMNNFLLASKNRQNLLKFIRQNIPSTELVHRVLFEIKIPTEHSTHKQRPFVDLSTLNDFNKSADEDDSLYTVLFFIGSIFRIASADFDMNNDCWIISLTLYDEELNQDFSQIFTFLNDSKRTNTENAIALANLLRQISPDSAEQFYKHLLKSSAEPLSKLECYRGLGMCSYTKDDSSLALDYFEKALNLKPSDKLTKSSLHNSIGLVYAQQDQLDEALEHFNKALENSSLPLHIACVHHNLALVYSQQGKHDEELEHYEAALKHRTAELPATHLQIASLYNNIGIVYADLREYNQAFVNLRKALEIRLKLLPEGHIEIARSYANMAAVYAKTREFRVALDYFNKASVLFEKQQPIPQQDIDQLKRNIKIVNDKLRRQTY